MSDQQYLGDELYELAMQKKWGKIAEKFENTRAAHTIKLTKSENTAFHIAVSSYNSKSSGNASREILIHKMIDQMKASGTLPEVLLMRNAKGDTPLHLAAKVGWEGICEIIATEDRELITVRNEKGETPLFIAAHHGNLEAFEVLHKISVSKDQNPVTLCRRKDGNTVLHSAISGEYFGLAYFIIKHCKNLVDYVNVDGETPLHVLARMPTAFRSSSQLRLYESVIYQFASVENLEKQIHNPRVIKNGSAKEKFPENCKTCVDIFHLLWDPISKSYIAGSSRSKKQDDEENQPSETFLVAQDPRNKMRKIVVCTKLTSDSYPIWALHLDLLSGCLLPVSPKPKTDKQRYSGSIPPNYTTCRSLFKLAMKVILTVLGIGFMKIKKIQEKRERHEHAMVILNEMIKSTPSYKYDSNGKRPNDETKRQHFLNLPDSPPNEDHEIHHTPQAKDQQKDDNRKDKKKSGDKKSKEEDEDSPILVAAKKRITKMVKKILSVATAAIEDNDSKGDKKSKEEDEDSPILVAAKMGITEMVKKILSAAPVAIEDNDSKGRNVLMLAVENRHTSLFEYLIKSDLPDYVFHHVDNEGNNILHLAAKLGLKKPWQIPGAALQMQWEIKWYKHVKSSVAQLCFSHHNAKGETPWQIFTRTHENLLKSGNDWLIKTSESCSVVAALIATVAFATSATVPGGLKQDEGYPVLRDRKAFDIFSIASLLALCLSITALVFFLAIITSRFEERDFKRDLPRRLLMGLTCLFSSISAMLLSFCAGHTFILTEKLRIAAMPIYAATALPVTLFAVAQLPLYFDLLWAAYAKVPLRSWCSISRYISFPQLINSHLFNFT